MKKNIFSIGVFLTLIGFITFGFINNRYVIVNHSNQMSCQPTAIHQLTTMYPLYPLESFHLLYEVESRFIATITKEDLNNAKSIIDIIPKEGSHGLTFYHDVKVALLNDNQ